MTLPNPSNRWQAIRLHHNITFGIEGNDAPFLGQGWDDAQLGYRCTKGVVSDVRLIHPGTGDVLLEIKTFVLNSGPSLAGGQIEVLANGSSLGTITPNDSQPVALYIASGRMPLGDILTLSFLQTDTTQAASFDSGSKRIPHGVCFSRLSLFTVQAAVPKRSIGKGGLSLGAFADSMGVPVDEALSCFEGLGETGEFAVVQARVSVKPPPFLLSAPIGLPHLLRGLDTGFADLGEPATFEVRLYSHDPVEFAVIDRNYAAEFRSTQAVGEIKLSEFIEQQRMRLHKLGRLLMQMVTSGEKIFVVVPGSRRPALTEPDVLPLLIALNRHGPNWLLWITESDENHPPGTVEQTIPFLLRGNIDRLQPDAYAKNVSIDIWLEICANALLIAQPVALAAQLRTHRAAHVEVAGKVAQAAPVQKAELIRASLVAAPESLALATVQAVAETRAVEAASAPSKSLIVTPEVEYVVLQTLVFGEGGNEEAALGFGWAGPEPGYRWTEAASCELWLDNPGQRNVVVTIEAWPLVMPPAVVVQRAEVSVHDARLATLAFTVPGRKSVFIPTTAWRPGRILRLRFVLPDSARPCDVIESDDDRQLGLGFIRLAVHAVSGTSIARRDGRGGRTIVDVPTRTGIELKELFNYFETLGESQIFLDIQGSLGERPLSLFHRVNLRLPDLITSIDARFSGFAEPDKLKYSLISRDPDSYEIIEETTAMNFVVECHVTDSKIGSFIEREARRLKFLRDKLLHDLSVSDKIFVYHPSAHEEVLSEATMLPLLIAMRQHGPCTLLFVTPADDLHACGTVERSFPGLLHGYLSAHEPNDILLTQNLWAELLVNAFELTATH